jgi:hypothetical protein
MKQFLIICLIAFSTENIFSQTLEVLDKQDFYQTTSVQKLKIPLRLKNNSDKQQTYIIRNVPSELGSPPKGYFCANSSCQELGVTDFSVTLEGNETIQSLYFVLETGIISGQTNLKLGFFLKGVAKEVAEHSITVSVEEKSKGFIFQSKEITIQDVYPNPASDQAFMEYKIHNENSKAKLLIHNILGRILGDYQLPSSEVRLKIPTEDLPIGVYFYTIYIDQEGVLTRKLVVRK